jgi:DNA replicative helicase MCM subunit Mcm2 (Cdc46/Mcm family)
MSDWGRRAVAMLAAVTLAGVAMGQESCAESARELEKSADELDKSADDLEKSQRELEDLSGDNDSRYRSKMKQVEIGMSKGEVRDIMGSKPRDTQVMESEYGKNETWYYGSYQLSFDNGKLTSKNRY